MENNSAHKRLSIQKSKYMFLQQALERSGFSSNQDLGQDELRLFLNNSSSSGYFDSILCNKLFKFININENESSTISIPEFIKGFLIFESDIKRKGEIYRIKLIKEQEIYNNILNQCLIYKNEKLNKEGFCENAKIYGEITDIDIKQKLKGINEIVIIVIFNNEREELHFKLGDNSGNYKKSFEFRPTSRKDYFEFIMKGVNDKNNEFNIGNKIFSLNDIESHEKYLVTITIPEIDNPEKIAAHINLSIVLYMSYHHYFETLRKKEENKMHKYKLLMTKSFEYLEYIKDIYDNISRNDYDGANTERVVRKIPLRYNFHRRSIRFNSPVIEDRKISYNIYKSSYNNSIINKNIRHYSPMMQRRENLNINEIQNFNNIKRIQNEYSPPPKTERSYHNISNYLNEININKETTQTKENTNYINHHVKSQSNIEHILHNQIPEPNFYKNIQTSYKKTVQKIPLTQYNETKQINYQTHLNQGNMNNELKEIKQETVQNNINSSNNEQNIKQIKEYNINNLSNSTNATKNITTTTKIVQSQNQKQAEISEEKNTNENQNNHITEVQRASVHQIIGEISKQKTITTETKILKPVIKNVINMKHLLKNAIVTQIVRKELVEERTLPIQYLPEKVNELIYTNKIITLPLINAEKKVVYKSFGPTMYNFKENDVEKKVINNINNISLGNIIVNNNNTKVINLNNNSNILMPKSEVNYNKNISKEFVPNNNGNLRQDDLNSNMYIENHVNKNENKELLKNSQGFYSSIQTIKIPINKSQVNHYKFKY